MQADLIILFHIPSDSRLSSKHLLLNRAFILKRIAIDLDFGRRLNTIRTRPKTLVLHCTPGIDESNVARHRERVCEGYDRNKRYRARSYRVAGNA